MTTILDNLKQTGEKEWKLEDRANCLLYATKRQAEIYSRLSRLHNMPERGILEEAGQAIVAGLEEPFNIVGLAAGQSERESILIKAALTTGKRPIYLAVDKSFEMLKASGINIPMRAETYTCWADMFDTDLLDEIRKTTSGSHNLTLLLGYTIFNFGRTKCLRYLQGNIASRDSAIVTVGTLPEDEDKLVADYSTPALKEFGLEAFLNAGFSENNLELKVSFEPRNKTLKFGCIILSMPQGAKNTNVSEGDYVVLFTSIKLPRDGKNGYLPLIARYLHIEDVYTEPTGMTAVVRATAKS